MKMLKFRLPHLIAVAAAAGLSLTAAYAVPSYQPDVNSPISLSGGAPDLSVGLGLIEAQLASGKTLVLPGVNDLPSGVKPSLTEFKAAVKAAAAVATDANKAKIVQAALTIGASSTYNFAVSNASVREVLKDYIASPGYTLAGAQGIVEAALKVNAGKQNDVVTGVILAIGDVGTAATEQDADDLSALAFNTMAGFSKDSSTKTAALVEGMVAAIVKSVKVTGPSTAPTGGFASATFNDRVQDIAKALVLAAKNSPAPWLVDDVVKGITKSARPLTTAAAGGLNFNGVMQAVSDVTVDNVDAHTRALIGVLRNTPGTDSTIPGVKAVFANTVGANANAIEAVANGYLAVGNTAAAGQATALSSFLNTANGAPFATNVVGNSTSTANLPYLLAGAGALSTPKLAGLIITDTLPFAAGNAPLIQQMVAAVSKSSNAGAGSAAAAAVSGGGLTAAQALAASLPNTPVANAGGVATSVTKAAATTPAADIITAAFNALVAASANTPENDFKAGIIDVTKSVITLRKTSVQDIATAGLAAAPASHRAAVAAAIGAADSKVIHTTMINTAVSSLGRIPHRR
jgi:hypothetical protein